MRNPRATVVIVSLLAIPVLLAGCDTVTEPEDQVESDLTTVEGAILTLEQCWDLADLDAYAGVFTDEFIFYFDPQDVDHGLPPSWGLQDELDAAGNIFDIVGANNIELTLTMPDGFDEPEDDTCTVNGVAYEIRVTHPDDDIIYAAQGMCNFSLDRSDGEWRFTTWYDLVGYRLLGGMSTSWGQIKAMN
ncbi:MAG: hypothetical protein GF403_03935 [Candidatus Coatesbacteria bacterium]|nr:hypothetical protein [Candidatus Coatesbacteria bacterium]